VGTTRSVDALFGKQEALDRLAVHEVGFDDLLNIVSRDSSIPDRVRINDYSWAVFALVQASGHIRTYSLLETSQREFVFEEELQLGLARGVAATARMSCLPLIAADKKMLLELRHSSNLQDLVVRRGPAHLEARPFSCLDTPPPDPKAGRGRPRDSRRDSGATTRPATSRRFLQVFQALGRPAHADMAHKHFQQAGNDEERTQGQTGHCCEQEDKTPEAGRTAGSPLEEEHSTARQ
jgi:hypothetical protein